MTHRFGGIAAVTLTLLGSGMMMSMCLPGGARPTGHTSDADGVHALLRAARSATSRDAGTFWLRTEETVTVHVDGTTREEYHNTGRILNDQGVSDGDVSISYDSASQTVTGIQARTIKPDGLVLAVRPDDVHQTTPSDDNTVYDGTKAASFSLPGVEADDLIDYRYTVLTHTPLYRGRFSQSWWLGDTDPCRLNRFTLIVPAGMALRQRVHNGLHVRFTQHLAPDGRTRTLCWENRDTPAVVSEPLMPPEESYLPWVEVSTWTDWQSVARWYQGLAGPRMTITPALAALAHRLTAGKTTERAKAQALFYWVEQRTRYVAVEMGLSAYQPRAADAVYHSRYGDCKDMATLLIALLHAAGIRTAWPALLDTDLKGPLHVHLAVPDTFDHVIVRADLDGQPYWFDATAALSAFGDIPGDDRGVEALIVRNGHGTFETIPPGGPADDRTICRKTITLHDDGSADCRTVVQSAGDAALETRTQFHDLPADQWAGQFQTMLHDQPSARLQKFSLSSCTNPGTPLTYDAAYRSPTWAIRTGDLLLVSDALTYTPPTDALTRRHPLCVTGANQTDYTATITLPPGYTIEAQPDDLDERLPIGEVRVTYQVSPGTVVIHKVFTQTPGIVAPADYPHLAAAFDHIAAALRQPVVLRHTGVQMSSR